MNNDNSQKSLIQEKKEKKNKEKKENKKKEIKEKNEEESFCYTPVYFYDNFYTQLITLCISSICSYLIGEYMGFKNLNICFGIFFYFLFHIICSIFFEIIIVGFIFGFLSGCLPLNPFRSGESLIYHKYIGKQKKNTLFLLLLLLVFPLISVLVKKFY